MKAVKLTLCMVAFTAGFAILGAFATLDNGNPLWFNVGTLGAFGVYVGYQLGKDDISDPPA